MEKYLWNYNGKVRAHTHDQKTKTHLMGLENSEVTGTYFFKERIIAWDIQNRLDKTKTFERIMQMKIIED